jgi:hypothetical protein
MIGYDRVDAPWRAPMSHEKNAKPKEPAAPSYASSPCSMHEFAADFGLDEAGGETRDRQRSAAATSTDETPGPAERASGD